MDPAYYKYPNEFSPRNSHFLQARNTTNVKTRRPTHSRDYADSAATAASIAAARSTRYHPPPASSVYSPYDENQDPSGGNELAEKRFDGILHGHNHGGGSSSKVLPYYETPVYQNNVVVTSTLGSKREQFIEMGIPTGSDDEEAGESLVSLQDVSLSSALPAYCVPIDLSRLGNPHRRMKFGPFYEDSQKDKEEVELMEGEESLIQSCSTIGSSAASSEGGAAETGGGNGTVKMNRRSSWFRKKVPQELLDMDKYEQGTVKKRSGSERSKGSKASSSTKSANKEKDTKKKHLLARVFHKS